MKGTNIERVILAARHPESLLGGLADFKGAVLQDTMINGAVSLSDLKSDIHKSYYVDLTRHWCQNKYREPNMQHRLHLAIELHIYECKPSSQLPEDLALLLEDEPSTVPPTPLEEIISLLSS